MGSPNIWQANNRWVTAFTHVLTYGEMGRVRWADGYPRRSSAGRMRRCGVIASPTEEEKDPWIAS